jgi:hypothetical protein
MMMKMKKKKILIIRAKREFSGKPPMAPEGRPDHFSRNLPAGGL